MKKIFRHWKIIYVISCLVYIGWMIHVGGNEFDRINGQYRRLAKQLEPARIRTAALEELASECRKDSRQLIGQGEVDCTSWKPAVVEAMMQVIAERQLLAKQRGTIKLVLFYTGFVVIFLLAPVILLYLFIAAGILLYKNIKIVR
jgi:hypothetical protein